MNLTTKATEITEFALDYGLVICQDRREKTLHQSRTTRQGTWMEVNLFKKINRFNERVRARDWRDRW